MGLWPGGETCLIRYTVFNVFNRYVGMRFLMLFLLISCAQTSLKYKYSSAKRYLASLTSEDTVVSRIEGELKHPVLFASGMDSTYLIVKLYDENGELLKDVDPSDLTLSAAEDINAKPFTNRQGIYKAEILPTLRSKDVLMRVDWKERTISRDIILRTTTKPLKDNLELLDRHLFQAPDLDDGRGSNVPTDGFSFENTGDNKIVNASKNPGTQRSFNFDYPEQARQNLSLEVWDAPSSATSHTMHSIFWFFPRKQLFLVDQTENQIQVTLPTGEPLIFQKDSKEIIEGVIKEGALDANQDKQKRQYPDLRYQGRGVVLRVNSRGQSPQLGQFETNKIDSDYGVTGSVGVLIINGTTGEKCHRPKSDFWEPIDVSPIEFKFPTDEEFDLYLRNNCGFGLPKF